MAKHWSNRAIPLIRRLFPTPRPSRIRYGNYDDPYGYNPYPDHTPEPAASVAAPAAPPPPASGGGASPPEDDDEDSGMLRMSFLEHLEELRSRLIYAIAGMGVAFILSLTFSKELWLIVQEPAAAAFKTLGYKDMSLVFTSPWRASRLSG